MNKENRQKKFCRFLFAHSNWLFGENYIH